MRPGIISAVCYSAPIESRHVYSGEMTIISWVIPSLTRWCDLGSCNTVITDGASLTCDAPPQHKSLHRHLLLSHRTRRRLLKSGGSLYAQCKSDVTGGGGCEVGSKCGYNPSAKMISGSFLDFNPKTNDGCCAYSKGLVETGLQSGSFAWCNRDSQTAPTSDESNPEEVRPGINQVGHSVK